ncbi:MAG: hypothetical protein ACD_14C00006G0002 [uncultured bacterium]|nr:MAG: hypothetical protein ACD_14C00006G0002 [uncultured bacterium]KKQ60278.1 MAG: hypothetical protein US82_C0041G0010 [Parcubacteria group bacterium GW2011_GWC1_38_22]KKQ79866.1 MAG: hypothetical protein UT03_C0039G0008 [Candidatus Moranbacteria bacterium GW2011_GWD2_38_7]
MNSFESIPIKKNDENKRSFTDGLSRKMKQFAVGASLLGATAQAVDGSEIRHDTQKVSEGVSIELIRKDLINHVSSPEYLAKLKIEFSGDAKLALDEQQSRIENLKTVKVYLKETSDEVRKLFESDGNKAWKNVEGFYDEITNEIISIKGDPSVLQHEFLHASTKNRKGITSSAKKVLHKTFFGMNGYLRNPTEWLVRKQALDLELARENIKEYGQPFTRTHYDIMMQMFHRGKFSTDVREFIAVTDRDFDVFKKILDNVAKNETGQDIANV